MVFNSFNFLIFFPVLAAAYWITPARYRNVFLLAASYFFYVNIKPVFALLVGGVTVSTYVFTRMMDASGDDAVKKRLMLANIALILLPLFFFKYFSVINAGAIAAMDSFGLRWPLPDIKLFLPIGISFYTFMAIGYTIDVYNEEIEAEKDPTIVALFLAFFPLILSGPIERAKHMLPQFRRERTIDLAGISQGMKLMLWGYFMKLVVADRIGIYVDSIYTNMYEQNGASFLFASILYPFQEYADFGGYSLIAIGVARVLGMTVMENFRRPFFAVSMTEFWRRWHISLISWLTDYIYTPVSFSVRKYKMWGVVIALMVTFFVSGLWHGAALTFLLWGLVQGAFLSIEVLLLKRRTAFETRFKLAGRAWYTAAACAVTFVLFAASEILGRTDDINVAMFAFRKIASMTGPLYVDLTTITYAMIGLAILMARDLRDEFYPERFRLFEHRNIAIRFASYLAIVYMIIMLGVLDNSQFIYFAF